MASRNKKPQKLANLKGKARRDRIAELISDPNTRAAVPTADLPSGMRKKREFSQRLDQPLIPGGVTSYRDFLRERKSAADQKFGPVQQQLEKQATDVPGWYDQYVAQLKQIQSDTRGEYDRQQQQAQSLAAASADTGGSQTGDAAAAGQSRAASSRGFAASLGQHGARSFEHFGNLQAIGAARKGQRRQEIAGQLKDLGRERGDFYNTYTGQARQQEFENAATAQTLGLKASEAQTDAEIAAAKLLQDAKDKRAGRAVTKRGQNISRRNTLDRLAAADEKAKKGKSPWGTPQQQSTAANKIGSAEHYAKTLKEQGLTRGQAAALLLQGQKGVKDDPKTAEDETSGEIPKVDQLWASIALDVAYDGHLSRRNVKRLHNAGIKVRPLGYRTRPPRRATRQESRQISDGVKRTADLLPDLLR